jgi:hypothetical protein
MAAYLEWKEHSLDVESTYSRWASARPSDAGAAYLAYAAALDHEARSSDAYADMVLRPSAGARPGRIRVAGPT